MTSVAEQPLYLFSAGLADEHIASAATSAMVFEIYASVFGSGAKHADGAVVMSLSLEIA